MESKAGEPLPGLVPNLANPPGKSAVPPATIPLPDGTKPKGDNATDYPFELTPSSIQPEFQERCPSPKDLKKVGELTTNIVPSAGDLPHDCPWATRLFSRELFRE